MKTIENNRMATKKLFFTTLLIISYLFSRAGDIDQKMNRILGKDSGSMTIFYIIVAMFVLCITIYLIGNYFMKKQEKEKDARKARQMAAMGNHGNRSHHAHPRDRHHHHRIIKKTT